MLMTNRSLPYLLPALCCALMILLSSCTSTSPRYRTAGDKPAAETEDESRLAPVLKEEETREDDRKVDMKSFKGRVSSRRDSTSYTNLTPAGVNRDQVLLNVVGLLGVPYAFGKSSRDGMDCSAFTSKIFSGAMNVQLPRSTRDQFRVGNAVTKYDLQFGDLVFFNTTGHSPSHVGIYIEDDLFAHASVSYGVTISSLESSYYKKRFVGAKRVVD